MMLNLAEYRNKPQRLADFLPTARFRGPDLESATPAELVGTAARLNNALRRLGSGWAVFVEAQRDPANAYPETKSRSGLGIG
jgi:type IV secretory pathway VirB4 component